MSLDLTDWQNKKYTTRDGRPVRILCVDGPGLYPVVGVWITRKGDIQIPPTWTMDGKYLKDSNNRDEDLINAKTKKEGWVNVYKEQDNKYHLCHSKELADLYANSTRIACIKIEWEE